MSVHRISDANGQAGHDTATSTRAVQQHRVNRLRNLDHVVLRTAHLPKLVAFYCDILGATVEREAPSIGMVQLRTGSSLLDVLDAAGSLGKLGGAAPGAEGRNMDHLCLALDDFDADALRTHLEKHGVEASPTLARYGADGDGPSVCVKDPDGNTVELKGYPTTEDEAKSGHESAPVDAWQPKLRNLDHVVLRTAHLPKLVAFYCDILGATVEREAPSIGMVQLRTGSSLLDVLDAAGSLGKLGGAAPGAEGRNMDHLCLALYDFDADALRTHLEKHGVEASPTLARYGADGDGPSVCVKDPDGNTVELKGYPPASD